MQQKKIFDMIGCNEIQKASFAIFMLKGEAEYQWRATKETLTLEEGKPLTWGIFLRAFYNYYFPCSVRDVNKIEYGTHSGKHNNYAV